jgi:2-oxoglutarate ferredoxin oxidoreductase subunit alpha
VANIANDIPDIEVEGDDDADILVLGWGSTFGGIQAAARRARMEGVKVATTHLRYINPLPNNLGDVLRSYDKILIPEMNTGQLLKVIRAEFLIDAVGLNKVAGEPFKVTEISEKILEMVK